MTAQPFKLELVQDFSLEPARKDWLLKGVIARGETSAWIGPPGSLKSALLAKLAFACATRSDFMGKAAKRRSAVVYFALERADLVRRRLAAHYSRCAADGRLLPVAVVAGIVDLTKAGTVQQVLSTLARANEIFGQPVDLAIFDTFPKLVAAGGGDEDKAKDQGQVFANIQRIKDRTGIHVALVGHTGKDEARGARGSNAILGDVDMMVTISGNAEAKVATVTKANDAPEGQLFAFKSETHKFGVDEDGEPIDVNIVSDDETSAPAVDGEQKLHGNERAMYGILYAAGAKGLTQAEWYAAAKVEGIGLNRPATLTNARQSLEMKRFVQCLGDRWSVRHD